MDNRRVDRAAQFLPFDALKGLQEELRKREEKLSRVDKIELSDEQIENISNTLTHIEIGSRVQITFYLNGHYFDVEGDVAKISTIYKYLTIGQQKIFFDDIYQIEVITA